MSGFTFAKGNAAKILAAPLYGLGALASLLVRRDRSRWVFASAAGPGEGALALYRFVEQTAPELRIVWLARDAAEVASAKKLGLKAAKRGSWRGFRLTLRAGVVVVTHGLGDANRFGARGAFVVQLWHGIPLKKIQLDSPVTFSSPRLLRGLLRRFYARSTRSIGLVPAASELSAARLRSAFGLPEGKVAVTGDPRDDVVLGETQPARALLESAIGDFGADRIILYAPTWRDGQPDPAIPSADEWTEISQFLEATESVLVLRPHPHGFGEYAAGSEASNRIRMLPSSVQGDLNPILPAVDILVTDYSSTAFDFALLGRPIAFLALDAAEYEASRGLYEPYSRFTGGSEVSSWRELIALLSDSKQLERLAAHSKRLAEAHHKYRDGRNTARVYEELRSRLGGFGMTAVAASAEAGGSAQSAGSAGSAGSARSTGSAEAAGAMRLADSAPPAVTITLIDDPASPAMEISGTGSAPRTVTLEGSRLTLAAEISARSGKWVARVPLLASRWGGSPLAPPSGSYRILVDGIDLNGSEVAHPESRLVPGRFRLAFRVELAEVFAVFTPPLEDDELGGENQARLEQQYRAAKVEAEDSVFFESFYGQNSSCNPLAIDRELARVRPELKRYWGVADASVAVPEGSIAVIEGSKQWWEARAASKLIVINDWLRNRFESRPHQKVLQTWHGTMLKRLAISRRPFKPRPALATIRERGRWDALLAQNDYAKQIFRRSYAYFGPIWEEGYPRDDVLSTGDSAAIRKRLGIPNSARVLLYAPTWRDDRPDKVDHLDVAEFSRKLGPDWVVLIRGHARTIEPGQNISAEGVIDVTSYPDVSEIFLAADVLVTDYSSVMFDFSVTGKPIYFYTPDLKRYKEQLRGFYFDLIPSAPGPVVQDESKLVDLVRHPDAVQAEYASKYAAWREKFNPHDDGHAAERVVARLIREGWI